MKRAIVAVVLACAATAHASPLSDELRAAGAGEAPIVARIDPAALPQVHAAIRARVPMLLRSSFDHALDAVAQQLGGDPFTPDGWRALGLDPARPIVVVAGLDADLRAIVTIRDPKLAAQTIARARAIAPSLAFALRGDLIAIDLAGRAEPPSTDAAIEARLRAAPALASSKAPIAIHVDPRLAPVPAAIAPIVTGSFGSLAATIDLRADGAAIVHATWDVVPRSALATALATAADRGLPRPSDTPDAILHVHTYFDLAALTAVPTRGMTFDLPSRPFLDDADAPAWVDALAWPYELGATMAHVIGAVPRAQLVFDGLHDAALVVTSVGDDLDHTAATLELAIDPAAGGIVRPLADGVWGAHTDAGWGSGRIRAFARTLASASTTVGLAVRDSAPAYLAIARTAPHAPKGLVLEIHAAPAALALLDPIAYFVGTLDLAARYDGRALAIDATLSP